MDTLGLTMPCSVGGGGVGIGGHGQTNRRGWEETLWKKVLTQALAKGVREVDRIRVGGREPTESDEPASAAAASARTPRVRFGSRERLASSAPPAPFTAATRSPPRAPKPTLPLAPPQTCRGPSPVPPCPSLAPWHFTFASGTPRETGVRLATPRDRDAAGTTTPAVAACSMATISREFVSALVR